MSVSSGLCEWTEMMDIKHLVHSVILLFFWWSSFIALKKMGEFFFRMFLFSCVQMSFSTLSVCAKLRNLVVGPAWTIIKYSVAAHGVRTKVFSRFTVCLVISLCFTWFQSAWIWVACFQLNKTSYPTPQFKFQLTIVY